MPYSVGSGSLFRRRSLPTPQLSPQPAQQGGVTIVAMAECERL